jgi:hypothetical protein
MITVIARWESTQMPASTEWQLYRQLRGAFGVNDFIFVPINPEMENYGFRQADTVKDALAVLPDNVNKVFLEPTGYNSLHKQPDGDIVYIIGNTAMHNMVHAQVNETYRIDTPTGPNSGHLYGSNALAVALALRWGQ